MPRGDACNHIKCYGEPCRMLTDEELTPTPEDLSFGQHLVACNWLSISTKYRTVARWKILPPCGDDMVTDYTRDTPHGQRLIKMWDHHNHFRDLRICGDDLVEKRVLTVREWAAFKQAGGQSA